MAGSIQSVTFDVLFMSDDSCASVLASFSLTGL